jgi:ferrous iron transport protein A
MSGSCSCSRGDPKSTKKFCFNDELKEKPLTFADLKPGDNAEILGYHHGDVRYKSKLLAMGLVRGVILHVLQVAPLGDPIEVSVLSYRLSLRKAEANILQLRKI